MLVIRKEQTSTMRAGVLAAFEADMALHCRSFASRLTDTQDDAALLSATRAAIVKAMGHELSLTGPLRLFVELTLLLGFAFDTDPQYPWAADILGDRAVREAERAERLYEKSLHYTDHVIGPDRRLVRSALKRMVNQAPSAASSSQQLLDALPREARAIYPLKASYIGQAALDSLVREASSVAERQGVNHAEADIFWLMLFFGHGCIDDPFLPQLGAALVDRDHRGAEERAGALRREARTLLDRSLELDVGEGQW